MGLGKEHPQLGLIPQAYGRALLGAGQAAAAVPMFQRNIAFHERKFGLHHYLIPGDLIDLAEALGQLGRGFDERLSLLNRAVAIRELSIGRDKDQNAGPLAAALEKCAECYEEAGRLVEAELRWAKCSATYTKVRLRFRTRAQFLGKILHREVAWSSFSVSSLASFETTLSFRTSCTSHFSFRPGVWGSSPALAAGHFMLGGSEAEARRFCLTLALRTSIDGCRVPARGGACADALEGAR